METIIKKPVVGKGVTSELLGLTGKVIDVIDYNHSFEGMQSNRLILENQRLERALGSQFRELYFECVIKIESTTDDSEYKGDNIAVISWEDYQTCEII